MSATAVAAIWCRACGHGDVPDVPHCPYCGTGLEPPASGPDLVGHVVEMRGRLSVRHGLALRETSTGVQVLVKTDTLDEVPAAAFAALPQVTVTGPQVTGAAGRLWAAQRSAAQGGLRATWSAELIADAARSQATASTGARRAAALDALTLGLPDVLSTLGLAQSELCWYRAWSAGQAGQLTAVLGWLEQLPAGRYTQLIALLQAHAAALLADSELAARATVLLEPFAGRHPSAGVLLAALAAEPGVAAADVLLSSAVAAGGADSELAAGASAILELTPPARPFPAGLPTCQALGAYLAGRSGTHLDQPADTLGRLSVALLDELIDGQVIPSSLATADWPADAAYLRCRLSPADATEAELTNAGFVAELARRRYLAGDQAALARLPSDDSAVRHYQALARWQSGRANGNLDGLRPDARRVLAAVDWVQSEAASGADPEVPELVVADPTCWELLREQALLGSLRLSAQLREQYPEFADWLDLSSLQQLALEDRWVRVISTGRALARECHAEAARDEALSIAAFAELQQGRPGAALQLLDEALAGEYTTGLIVNASIVAAAKGSLAAMPYLTRIVRLETDQRVRAGAIERAIGLWARDDAVTDYPGALRDLVRAALAEAQPDQLFQRLLAITDNNDTAWLAGGGTVYVSGADQAELLRYRRTWARARTEGHDETLASVAEVLADCARATPRAEWVAVELPHFTDGIDAAVHCPFGEGLYLVPAIDTLLEADVLEPAQQLVFAAQAGAHVAFYLAEHDDCIAPDAEQRLLFQTVQRFGREELSLPESAREYVAEELRRCLTAASHAMALVVDREFGRRGEEWNALVRREQYEPANREQILRAERALLDDLAEYVDRAQNYLSLLNDLKLTEKERPARATLAEAVTKWATEINRLRRLM